MLAPPPRETRRTELLDRLDLPAAELAGSMADLARLNSYGATRAILAHLAPFFDGRPGAAPLRILDVGSGGADIPLALAGWAERRGRAARVLALDIHLEVVRVAARAAADAPAVRVVAGDALAAPVRPGSVDVAMCSLVLHHLPEDGVVALLRELAALARLGVVVSDLRRGWVSLLGVWLATRAISRNRVTRHDGPLSVRRAYTPAELARLAARAGLGDMRWHPARPFRVVGVWRRPGA